MLTSKSKLNDYYINIIRTPYFLTNIYYENVIAHPTGVFLTGLSMAHFSVESYHKHSGQTDAMIPTGS